MARPGGQAGGRAWAMLALAVCIAAQLAGAAAQDWYAGAASIIITPPVNGTTDYVAPVDEFDAASPGTLVVEFDQGTIPVGNGNSESYWVRDHVRATAMTLRDTNGTTLVVLSVDVYMLFANDLELYYDAVRTAVGDTAFARLRFIAASTHNHHGPDTSGLSGLNREWYAWMLDRLVTITVTALNNQQPVTLTVADGDWLFGLGDVRDPLLVDPRVTVLQARAVRDNSVVATIVQWAFHPEVTLGFKPTVPTSDCEALGQSAPCSAQGRYLSADFPGHLQNYLNRAVGGEVVYLNGAIGVQIGPHGPVWEVSDEFPISGDGSVPPPNAPLVPRNFRSALLIGRELANAVVRMLSGVRAAPIAPSTFDYKSVRFYTYLSNPLFRLGLFRNPTDPTRPLIVGYTLRDLYVCNVTEPPTDETCVFDNYETIELPRINLPFRKGNFVTVETSLLQLGPMKWLTLPGELAPELANGLPADFDLPESTGKYYSRPDLHAVGAAYTMPGVLKDMLECDYCLMVGLGNDEGGYIFPISDWRLGCVGDTCEFDGYNSGTWCKDIIESGEVDVNCYLGV